MLLTAGAEANYTDTDLSPLLRGLTLGSIRASTVLARRAAEVSLDVNATDGYVTFGRFGTGRQHGKQSEARVRF